MVVLMSLLTSDTSGGKPIIQINLDCSAVSCSGC